jgi:hypothetical protein
VAAPGILRRVLGERSAPLLESADRVMTRHSTLVMAAVLLVLGLILVGNGLTGL